MSYAAFKMVHSPTGVESCASAFLTHSPVGVERAAVDVPNQDVRSLLSRLHKLADKPALLLGSSLPNLVISKANVLEVYYVRCQEEEGEKSNGDAAAAPVPPLPVGQSGRRSGNMHGISAAWLELACSYRLHGNVESMAVLSNPQDEGRRRRDAIILAFRDAKISVLEFDDATHGLRTSSMHYFEGPDWEHLKRGRERFARGPQIRAEPIGRCAGVLVYDCQMVVLRAAQVGYGLDDEDDGTAPPAASVSAHIASSYVVNLRGVDMRHVKDFVFLHGYNEPVILALHEMEPTWAGRVAVKRFTCCITALSINTALMQHTLFWSAADLPYDAYKLIAVPSPVEGVLVFCANTLHYYNQSSSCALALNEFAAAPDGSLEMPMSKIAVELDGAQVSWISHDVALFSTKGGNLLLLHLDYDGRTVHKLELSKSRASVLASCMCMVGENFFFLGSRLGDSLLVQFTPLASGASPESKSAGKEEFDIEAEMPASKKARHSLLDSQDTAEELLLYSPERMDTQQRKTFAFAVRDSLVNIGPLRDFAQGLRQSTDDSATGVAKQSNYELVASSGHGKNGSVSVLHQSIRPDLITAVNLPGCTGVWTVYHTSGNSNHIADAEDSEYHAYLIICLETRTMILETGETLGEVTENVGYCTQAPTILAGNIFGRSRVVQVHPRGVRLLDGAVMTQDVPTLSPVSESPEKQDLVIVSASLADPYIVLRMSNGSAQLIVGDAKSSSLNILSPSVLQTSAGVITTCTLFVDRAPGCWMEKTCDPLRFIDPSKTRDQACVYCVICRKNGSLEICRLPELSRVFFVRKFTHGRSILSNYISVDNEGPANGASEDGIEAEQQLDSEPIVIDVCMETWDRRFGRPFLLAILSDGTMLCYHAYRFDDTDGSALANIVLDDEPVSSPTRSLRFVRLPIDWMSAEDHGDHPTSQVSPKFVPFQNIGNVRGFFVTGTRPGWLMVSRERIRLHPQYCDGAILAFTPLHNVNCSFGLIYATGQGVLKICQLPALLNYDNDWPVQKIPIRSTPHQITYHADAGLYAVIISSTLLVPAVDSGDEHGDHGGDYAHDSLGGEESQKYVAAEVFEVRIIGPAKSKGLWETKGTLPMHHQENAVTVKIVTVKILDQDQTQTLLAIGTAYAQGEDTPAKGRIILVAFEEGQADGSMSFREVYSKEMKGSISAIASLQGNLLLAIGAKIILHTWNGSELNGAAFFDAPLYVVSLNIVKNFVLFGDVHKSIYFLNWKEEGAQLICLAKDFSSLDCFTSEFLIDGSSLSLLVSDSRKNIQIFSYAPKSVESWKGQKLLPRAEFHVGAHVAKFLRLQMLPAGTGGNRANRFAVLFGTLDGGINYLAPLDELMFRRLQTLQKKLVDVVPHIGGLNPRAFRQFQCGGTAHRPGPDNIVDCELLCHYTMLALDQQIEVARQIGTTRALILSNLRELSSSASFL